MIIKRVNGRRQKLNYPKPIIIKLLKSLFISSLDITKTQTCKTYDLKVPSWLDGKLRIYFTNIKQSAKLTLCFYVKIVVIHKDKAGPLIAELA